MRKKERHAERSRSISTARCNPVDWFTTVVEMLRLRGRQMSMTFLFLSYNTCTKLLNRDQADGRTAAGRQGQA